MTALYLRFLLSCGLVLSALAVDHSKFRTCSQTRFCARNRDRVPEAQFHVVKDSVKAVDKTVVGKVVVDGADPLDMSFTCYEDGALRVRITEVDSARYESPDILLPETELLKKAVKLSVVSEDANSFTVQAKGTKAIVNKDPFRIDLVDANDVVIASMNSKGKMHFEQRRSEHMKDGEKATALDGGAASSENDDSGRKVIDWGEDGKPIYEDGGDDDTADEEAAENAQLEVDKDSIHAPESFGGHTDNKPKGAQSVGFDTSFPGVKHIYGLPEHASPFSLKSTRGGGSSYDDPYRMYNLDVFEYEIDVPMALYGHIPIVTAQKPGQTTSVFFNNPSEMFVDVADSDDGGKTVHWMSETGIIEVFLMPGPTPRQAFRQYSALTGTTPIPPMFSLGYHQCRWNYRDEKDVREVNSQFEAHDLPYDVIWLDIEHTDGKRYFTWDKDKFPTPKDMQDNIAHYGRKMVTIVDPHLKRDNNYYIHSEAEKLGLYIKDKTGQSDFKGWCWPGDSSYLDFTNPKVRTWWADQFSFDNYKGSTEILHTWNDMNEPSVFNGPEVSMSKESLSLDGVEHREWHNLYGFYQHMATAEGLVKRTLGKGGDPSRSFVLSRSFYAGSQRHGAIWTGDNAAEWDHLKIASDMLLSLNVGGLPFAGADVGGFFGNPDEELLQRWYQAASFQPFFRAHAHIDTKRREPWLFGEEVLERISKAVKTRYSLLPLWYTVFREHEVTGMPVMRPLWSLTPEDEETFGLGDEWLIGHELLVKPVTDAGTSSVKVYLPKGTSWYQFESPHALHQDGGFEITEDAPLNKIPVFQRAGSIIPRKMRVRRSTKAMISDPYTLVAARHPKTGRATGSIYVDDENTFAYQNRQAYCDVEMVLESNSLAAQSKCSGGFSPDLKVERIIVLGYPAAPSQVVLDSTKEALVYSYDSTTKVLTIRKPLTSFIQIPFKIEF